MRETGEGCDLVRFWSRYNPVSVSWSRDLKPIFQARMWVRDAGSPWSIPHLWPDILSVRLSRDYLPVIDEIWQLLLSFFHLLRYAAILSASCYSSAWANVFYIHHPSLSFHSFPICISRLSLSLSLSLSQLQLPTGRIVRTHSHPHVIRSLSSYKYCDHQNHAIITLEDTSHTAW